jgi:cytochrome c-type biogenesis protein CcmF
MQSVGQFLLHLTFFASLVAMLGAYAGARYRRAEWVHAARLGLNAVCLMTITMALALLHSLVVHDFSNKYVATYTDLDMSWPYVVAAFWGGEKGALLFWTTSLSIFGAIAVHKVRNKELSYQGNSLGTLLAALGFFYMLMVFESSPFESFLTFDGPKDGKGMNPLLQNPTMTIHPPSLLTGYIAFTIPFAFGFGALLSGKLDDEWAKDTRTWTIVSWIFLTIGLILGGMWAYEELGWGGYWAWDPVENAGFIPWLTATAFLHSIMIQERRGMLKRWNFFLVLLTFLLTIFGTFLTRSQLIDSIHAFADSTLADYFLWYMAVIVVASAAALIWRWKLLAPAARIESMLSRESMFVLNNIVLLGLAFVVLWGTVFAKVSELEAVQGGYNWAVGLYNSSLGALLGNAEPITQAVVLGEPWFNRVAVPLGLVLLLLTGIGPIIAWGRATRKNFEKNFRLPLAIACLGTGLGGLIYAVVRVFAVRAERLTVARADWFDAVRDWAQQGLANGELPGALPAMPAPELGAAYSTWISTLSRIDAYSFVAFLFSAFVTATIAIEFVVGATARQKKHGGGFGLNLLQLTLKARRRYGGYVIHLGIVLAFIAFAGTAFKAEQPEQALYVGDRIDLGGYHLTYAGNQEQWREEGAYVANQATMVVMREGEAPPRPLVEGIREAAKARGWEPFHLETLRNSPAVRLRFVRDDARRQALDAAFLDTFFRERFALDSVPKTGKAAFFRVKKLDVVEVLPPTMHKWAETVREHFAAQGDGSKAQFTPGSPRFSVEFASRERLTEFVDAYGTAPAFGEAHGSRFNEDLGALEIYPKGAGFTMLPEVRFYRKHPEPTTEVAIRSSPLHDLYLAMRPATGRGFINITAVVLPLVSFLWLGALVMVFGAVICLLPQNAFSLRRSAAPAAARTTALLLLLGLATLNVGPSTALAQSGDSAEEHGAATPLTVLPPSDVETREEALDRLYGALRCVDREGGAWNFREGSLASCKTATAGPFREQLAARLDSAAPQGFAMAIHSVLVQLVEDDPANERLLAFPGDVHGQLMRTTHCYCGCSDAMSLSQCPLSCANSKEWSTRFKLLLSQQYGPDDIRSVYLASKNATLEPGEVAWTMENVRTDSRKELAWLVPAVVVGGAGVAFFALMSHFNRKRPQRVAQVAAAPAPTGLSDRDRALLEEELEDSE